MVESAEKYEEEDEEEDGDRGEDTMVVMVGGCGANGR